MKKSSKKAEITGKITKGMTLGEIIEKYPETAPVFMNYGLHCLGCTGALFETLVEAVKIHQIDLNKFLKDLNRAIK
jgi:hybrid cluster-associated redox disulfide protein